jgi:hypothetical protein
MVLRDVQKHRELKKFANHCSRRLISKYFCKMRGCLGLWGWENSAGTGVLNLIPPDQVIIGSEGEMFVHCLGLSFVSRVKVCTLVASLTYWNAYLLARTVSLSLARIRFCFCAFSQNCGKRLLSSSLLSVCLSTSNNSAPTRRIFMKFSIWGLFRKSVDKIHVSWKFDESNVYFTWRSMFVFYNILLISS